LFSPNKQGLSEKDQQVVVSISVSLGNKEGVKDQSLCREISVQNGAVMGEESVCAEAKGPMASAASSRMAAGDAVN